MAPEVRVSGPNYEAIGVLSLAEALRMAGELDVDLVEISPTAVPPVCRLMDYGKFKYQEQKKAAEAKSKQKVIEVKEIKFRPGTDDGDYNIKLRNIKRFLAEGMECELIERQGKPAFVICDVADEINADVIVMGTRGLNLEPDEASTASRVIQLAPCPVLVVP